MSIFRKCCLGPPNCDDACAAESPMTTSSFSSPDNGTVSFSFPVPIDFECRAYAHSACLETAWATHREQECEQAWPSTNPTAGYSIGDRLYYTNDCKCPGPVVANYSQHWFRQTIFSFRAKQSIKLAYRWYLDVYPSGTTGLLYVKLSLQLKILTVLGTTAGARTRMRSITATCDGFDQQVISAIDAGWTTASAVTPLTSPPLCVHNASTSCLDEITTPASGTCTETYPDSSLSGNDVCGGTVSNYKTTVVADCNINPDYPAYDLTRCGMDLIRANNTTGSFLSLGDHSIVRVYDWVGTVDCTALRSGAITLTTTHVGDQTLTAGTLISGAGCTPADISNTPVTYHIPDTLSITFA